MKSVTVILAVLITAIAILATGTLGRSSATTVRPVPSTVPLADCTCTPTDSYFNNCTSCPGIIYSNIVIAPGQCTPTCENDLPCYMTTTMTFLSPCSGAFQLKTEPACDTSGTNSHRCPGDPTHDAGISLNCGVCAFH